MLDSSGVLDKINIINDSGAAPLVEAWFQEFEKAYTHAKRKYFRAKKDLTIYKGFLFDGVLFYEASSKGQDFKYKLIDSEYLKYLELLGSGELVKFAGLKASLEARYSVDCVAIKF